MTRRFSVSGGGESTLRSAANRCDRPRRPRATTRGRIGQANERQERHAINLSSGTPRPKTMKESSLRQVSWLSVQRAPPTFPDASSGMCWRSARRLQLRGQPRNSNLAVRHRIPVLIPRRGTINGTESRLNRLGVSRRQIYYIRCFDDLMPLPVVAMVRKPISAFLFSRSLPPSV